MSMIGQRVRELCLSPSVLSFPKPDVLLGQGGRLSSYMRNFEGYSALYQRLSPILTVTGVVFVVLESFISFSVDIVPNPPFSGRNTNFLDAKTPRVLENTVKSRLNGVSFSRGEYL